MQIKERQFPELQEESTVSWKDGFWMLESHQNLNLQKILEKMAPYKHLILEPFPQKMHERMYSFFYPSMDGYSFLDERSPMFLKCQKKKLYKGN